MGVPLQGGRIAIMTGANSGIGLETAAALAAAGAKTVLACRSDQRAAAARVEILRRHPGADVELLRLDLGDLRQVAEAATEAKLRLDGPAVASPALRTGQPRDHRVVARSPPGHDGLG